MKPKAKGSCGQVGTYWNLSHFQNFSEITPSRIAALGDEEF